MKKRSCVPFLVIGMVVGFLVALIGFSKIQQYTLPEMKCYTTSLPEKVKEPHPLAGTFEHEVKRTE